MSKKKPKSKSKPKKSNHKPVAVKRTPRQEALPGLEDRAIKAIDNAAAEYADCRDQRQALTAQESSLKTELLELMHRHKKTHYKHGTVEITIKPEGEKITVRIKDENEEKPDDTQPEKDEPDVAPLAQMAMDQELEDAIDEAAEEDDEYDEEAEAS